MTTSAKKDVKNISKQKRLVLRTEGNIAKNDILKDPQVKNTEIEKNERTAKENK